MRIAGPGRFVFVAQWPLAVLLPVWVFLGRGLVGAELGWMAVLGVSVYGIPMIVILLIPPLVSLFDRDVRAAKAERAGYSFATWIVWISVVLSALVIPDSADAGPADTALTRWTGGAVSNDLAEDVFYALFVVGNLALLLALALAIAGIVRSRGRAEV